MISPVQHTALMGFLKSRHDVYYGKVLELREEVARWLAYIPQTFPHYTQHTVEHSDEIILQISKLLFRDDDFSQPVVSLSPVEAYVLIAAAYLHDIGMVVSDKDKEEILRSEAWKRFTEGDGAGAKRWREIKLLRDGLSGVGEVIRHFLADVQTRFLVAEFVRRTHHYRAAQIMTQHQGQLGRFAFDDPMLLRTIADVCLAHGLRQHELEDRERYPDRRDIHGQTVNVRFLAIMLRLGDLLDMRCDRACPLLLNAACPLPSNSLAHWSQYQRITHRFTGPDRVELTAECETQDEHRFLQDWCQWLADEIRDAGIFVPRGARHREWQAPVIRLDGNSPTITIRPAPNARYRPSKWTFELDQEIVFQRLIQDVYDRPLVFVRELIQNALDASRCQMYADLQQDGVELPDFPTQVDEDRRRRYRVEVGLVSEQAQNPLSAEDEVRQVLWVDDRGIGMDSEVIQRYFLQVGRSYYTTDEFRRRFRFAPTSRFGVGFLSVFAVSDHVVVETFKPSSLHQEGPIRLTLTGPRNYLLTERGARQETGTRIEVRLREPIAPGELTRWVSSWCRRVEFPIVVDDLGHRTTISAERAEQFTYEMPDVTKEGAKFVVRAFPVNRAGVEGELYVFAQVDERGESWDAAEWARQTYPEMHPQAIRPRFPQDLVCLHGIRISSGARLYSSRSISARLDYRGEVSGISLSRSSLWSRTGRKLGEGPEIISRWEEILRQHLEESPRAKLEDGWRYKQRLVRIFPFGSFWLTLPETIRAFKRGKSCLMSLTDIKAAPNVTVVLNMRAQGDHSHELSNDDLITSECDIGACGHDAPVLLEDDLADVSSTHRSSIFTDRRAISVRWLTDGRLAIDWTIGEASGDTLRDAYGYPFSLVEFPNAATVGVAANLIASQRALLLNEQHPFVLWLISVHRACTEQHYGLRPEQFSQIMSMVDKTLRHGGRHLSQLSRYLAEWLTLPGLPPELYPQDIKLTVGMFSLQDARPSEDWGRSTGPSSPAC